MKTSPFLILVISLQLIHFVCCNNLIDPKDGINILFEYSENYNNGTFLIFDFTNKNKTNNLIIKDKISESNFSINYDAENKINIIPYLNNNFSNYSLNLSNFDNLYDNNLKIKIYSLKIIIANGNFFFNLLQLNNAENSNSNFTNFLIEPEYNQFQNKDNFYVLPQYLLSYFNYSDCANLMCENSKKLSDNNQHNFKIEINEEISNKLEINLDEVKILMKDELGIIIYYKDITDLIKLNENIPNLYSFNLETLPDEFDLILIYTLRNKIKEDINNVDNTFKVNLILKFINFILIHI